MKQPRDWKEADRHVRSTVRTGDPGFGELRQELRARILPDAGFDSREYDLIRIQRAWKKIAGPLAGFSYPVRFRGEGTDCLEVVVENSAHAQEVSLYSKEILRGLRALGCTVKQLRSRAGRVPYDRMQASPERKPPGSRTPGGDNPGLDGLLRGLQ